MVGGSTWLICCVYTHGEGLLSPSKDMIHKHKVNFIKSEGIDVVDTNLNYSFVCLYSSITENVFLFLYNSMFLLVSASGSILWC